MSDVPCSDALHIGVEPRGDLTVVTLSGSANMNVSGRLRESLVELVSEERPHLILDLTDLSFISSVALGGIVAAYLRCRRYDGAVQVISPQPAIRDVFRITKLDKLFPMHTSIESAIRTTGAAKHTL